MKTAVGADEPDRQPVPVTATYTGDGWLPSASSGWVTNTTGHAETVLAVYQWRAVNDTRWPIN